jgi:sulfonate transport system ATP-binding protein
MATSLPTRVAATPRSHVASVRGLTRAFGDRRILDGLDLAIEQGEFVALLGRSGSGKSTLLRALAGLDHETTGELTIDGTVAVAFQEPRLLPWKRVIDNVALGLPARGQTAGGSGGGRARRTRRRLAAHAVRRRGTARLPGPRART